jgi:hypothetical protein
MLETIPTSPGFLFASFLYRRDLHSEEELKKIWNKDYGAFSEMTPDLNPLFNYYQKEMGTPLSRFLLISQDLFSRDHLLLAKLRSMAWEKSYLQEGKRSLNVDIGFLSPENFLLATTKNYSHRIFLGQDIFADLTFQFQKGRFRELPWTYPDYLDEAKISFLTQERDRLLARLSS